MAASTQNQTLSAILFLCQEMLHKDLERPLDAVRAKKPKRLLTVLTKDVKTTMLYTHVLNRGGLAVRSPLDET